MKNHKKIKFWWYSYTLYANFWKFINKILLHIHYIPKRRIINKHNRTNIVCNFDFSRVKVWNYTYGNLDIWEIFWDSYVKIRNYCSIDGDVQFICWNHNIKLFSTYPFASITTYFGRNKINIINTKIDKIMEHKTNWPIIVDDVWIWT